MGDMARVVSQLRTQIAAVRLSGHETGSVNVTAVAALLNAYAAQQVELERLRLQPDGCDKLCSFRNMAARIDAHEAEITRMQARLRAAGL